MDENTERRNHYLDLAGIENYTSKFGPGRYWRTPTLYLPSGFRCLPEGASRQGALDIGSQVSLPHLGAPLSSA